MLRPAPRTAAITSATGAGDAFSAAVLYGIAKGFDREKLLVYGMAAASAALESRAAVNPAMSIAEIEKRIKANPAVEGSL